MIIKAVRTEDNVTICQIPPGVYRIDQQLVVIDGFGNREVCVKDPGSMVRVRHRTVITHYENADGEKIDPVSYDQKVKELTSKAEYDEDDPVYIFQDLDEEYAYKKYIRSWFPVSKKIEVESEPVEIAVTPITLETGNPFITSMFCLGVTKEEEQTLYVYNRPDAVVQIVKDTFERLGFEFRGNINYGETNKKKIWGNSNHSTIRFVVAFGTYLFNDSWDVKAVRRGSLEEMTRQYEKDKKELELIIKSKYSLHFENPILCVRSANNILANLEKIASDVSEIDSKTKTQDKKTRAATNIRQLISDLKEELANV